MLEIQYGFNASGVQDHVSNGKTTLTMPEKYTGRLQELADHISILDGDLLVSIHSQYPDSPRRLMIIEARPQVAVHVGFSVNGWTVHKDEMLPTATLRVSPDVFAEIYRQCTKG